MQLSAELSLYPLEGDIDTLVLAFIDDLVRAGTVSAVPNTMSTQITGDWDDVITAVSDALKLSSERAGRQVLVAKFLPRHRTEVGPGD